MNKTSQGPAAAIRESLTALKGLTSNELCSVYRFTTNDYIKHSVNEVAGIINAHTDMMENQFQSMRRQIERLQATVDQQAQKIRDYEDMVKLSETVGP